LFLYTFNTLEATASKASAAVKFLNKTDFAVALNRKIFHTFLQTFQVLKYYYLKIVPLKSI